MGGKGIMMIAAVAAGTTFGAAPALAAPAAKPSSVAICSTCHRFEPGQKSPLGPNLFGIGGKTAGQVAGFAYSPAMKGAGFKWDKAKLMAFIANPRATVPGTKMAYAGQKDAAKQAEIADYLLSLK